MSRDKQLLTALCLGALLTSLGCSRNSSEADQKGSDSLSHVHTDTLLLPVTDTLRGTILDASTRSIELSVALELGDQVQRHSTLEVGSDIGVVIRHNPDGTQTILSTVDVPQE